MHTNIRYSGTTQEKDAQAIKDIINWFGEAWYYRNLKMFKGEIRAGRMDKERFEVMMSFAGVEGYPVEAWWRYLNA